LKFNFLTNAFFTRLKNFKIKVSGRRFQIFGQINPWVLLADGTIKYDKNLTDVNGNKLLKGDRVDVGGVDGIVVSTRSSKDVKDLAAMTQIERAAKYQERILTGDSQVLARRMNTPSGEQAHHAMSSSVVKTHSAGTEAANRGWDLNHSKNGINIPEDKLTTRIRADNALDPSKHDLPVWHKGGHTADYYRATERELDDVMARYTAFTQAGGDPKKFNWIKEMNKASQNMIDKLLSGDLRLYND
jgi:hypothetical protein